MQEHSVEGYEHVISAASILKLVVDDLFGLPGAAQDRAISERERLGEENHGDDLLCGCWAAAESATAILELGGRHIDAVLHLAHEHPGFASSAGVLGRGALEALLRVSWLLDPDKAPDREQRWVALKREEARFYKNAGFISESHLEERLADLDAIAEAIGGEGVTRLPSAEQLAQMYGRTPVLYDFFYRWNSQPTHGTIVGAGTFDADARFKWNDLGGPGEWIEAEFWGMPLVACWEGAAVALRKYRDLLVPAVQLSGLGREDEFRDALKRIPPNYQARYATEKSP